MIKHDDITDPLLNSLIRTRQITLGGNLRLKIYGTLHCRSGKRMMRTNRVFFTSPQQAIYNGFRPCGHCMREEYKQWKSKVHF